MLEMIAQALAASDPSKAEPVRPPLPPAACALGAGLRRDRALRRRPQEPEPEPEPAKEPQPETLGGLEEAFERGEREKEGLRCALPSPPRGPAPRAPSAPRHACAGLCAASSSRRRRRREPTARRWWCSSRRSLTTSSRCGCPRPLARATPLDGARSPQEIIAENQSLVKAAERRYPAPPAPCLSGSRWQRSLASLGSVAIGYQHKPSRLGQLTSQGVDGRLSAAGSFRSSKGMTGRSDTYTLYAPLARALPAAEGLADRGAAQGRGPARREVRQRPERRDVAAAAALVACQRRGGGKGKKKERGTEFLNA